MKNYTIIAISISAVLFFIKPDQSHTPPQPPQEPPENCVTNLNPNPLSDKYKEYLSWLEQEYELPKGLLFAVMLKESSGNPTAISPAGAQGLFQFMPNTSSWLQIDPFSPYQAADGAAKYLKYLIDYFGGSLELGLAAYNAGMGNVRKYGMAIPPFQETQQYVAYLTNQLNS